jgi:hypothetical protein
MPVIPSRADRDRDHGRSADLTLGHPFARAKIARSTVAALWGRKLIGLAVVRSLAVCVARDDTPLVLSGRRTEFRRDGYVIVNRQAHIA